MKMIGKTLKMTEPFVCKYIHAYTAHTKPFCYTHPHTEKHGNIHSHGNTKKSHLKTRYITVLKVHTYKCTVCLIRIYSNYTIYKILPTEKLRIHSMCLRQHKVHNHPALPNLLFTKGQHSTVYYGTIDTYSSVN